jgi:hypothetical protein
MRTLGVGCGLLLALGGAEGARHDRRNNIFDATSSVRGTLGAEGGAPANATEHADVKAQIANVAATSDPGGLLDDTLVNTMNVSQNLKQCLELRVGEAGMQSLDLPSMVVNARRRLVSRIASLPPP